MANPAIVGGGFGGGAINVAGLIRLASGPVGADKLGWGCLA